MRRLDQYFVKYSTRACQYRLAGKVYSHPTRDDGETLYIGIPQSLDEESEVVTTYAGNSYQLLSPDGDKEETFRAIQSLIQNNGEYI